ncbi:unnamed protein product [Amoebophrya sp. A25]|nr:unnamed protein product [Amoebophrya sp. A25]|eukprot:GSA25T00017981001.1
MPSSAFISSAPSSTTFPGPLTTSRATVSTDPLHPDATFADPGELRASVINSLERQADAARYEAQAQDDAGATAVSSASSAVSFALPGSITPGAQTPGLISMLTPGMTGDSCITPAQDDGMTPGIGGMTPAFDDNGMQTPGFEPVHASENPLAAWPKNNSNGRSRSTQMLNSNRMGLGRLGNASTFYSSSRYNDDITYPNAGFRHADCISTIDSRTGVRYYKLVEPQKELCDADAVVSKSCFATTSATASSSSMTTSSSPIKSHVEWTSRVELPPVVFPYNSALEAIKLLLGGGGGSSCGGSSSGTAASSSTTTGSTFSNSKTTTTTSSTTTTSTASSTKSNKVLDHGCNTDNKGRTSATGTDQDPAPADMIRLFLPTPAHSFAYRMVCLAKFGRMLTHRLERVGALVGDHPTSTAQQSPALSSNDLGGAKRSQFEETPGSACSASCGFLTPAMDGDAMDHSSTPAPPATTPFDCTAYVVKQWPTIGRKSWCPNMCDPSGAPIRSEADWLLIRNTLQNFSNENDLYRAGAHPVQQMKQHTNVRGSWITTSRNRDDRSFDTQNHMTYQQQQSQLPRSSGRQFLAQQGGRAAADNHNLLQHGHHRNQMQCGCAIQPVVSDNLCKGAIRRLARRGGVKRLSSRIYAEARYSFQLFLEKLVETSYIYCVHRQRHTVRAADVVRACKHVGRNIYGIRT